MRNKTTQLFFLVILGLFICRRIINAHEGEITAESKLGEGTTFHIYLPILNHHNGEAIEQS